MAAEKTSPRGRAWRLGLAGVGLAVVAGGLLFSACGGKEGEKATPSASAAVENARPESLAAPGGTPGAQVEAKAAGAPDIVAGTAAVVQMTDDLTFQPREVEIRVGQTVTWRNASVLLHTVTGDPGESAIEGSASLPEGAQPFSSGVLESGQSFSHTFTVPGRYDYFCIPHEAAKMRGTVIVRP